MTRGSRLRPLARAVLRTQSDQRLVALAREGREAAYEEIVRRYRPGLVAFAAAYAPSDRVEDVVQESLVRAWQALGQTSEEMHLKAWLYTIVRNRALNARRDAKAHEPLSEQIDGVPQPTDIVLGREELAAVVGAVNALPDPQREALIRSAVEGHTHDQIAAALGSSVGGVRQLIYRARLNLRSGVGLLIPLPLVRMLAEHGGDAAAVGGVAVGGAALGAAGGASALTKVATVAAIGTIAAGAGVAIESATDGGKERMVVEQRHANDGASRGAANGSPAGGGSDQSGGLAEGPAASDDSGGGSGDGDDSDSQSVDAGRERGDDSGPSPSSGPSDGGDDPGEDSDDDGSDSSGPGPSGDDDDSGDDDHSGSGGGGSSGSSGSGSSGSGSGGSGSDGDSDMDSSGSGSSGSGSSGSGSSGSGDEVDEDDSGSDPDSSGSGPGDSDDEL